MTITLDPSIALDDLLRAAADDNGLELEAPARRRLAWRMAELLELTGVELVRPGD